MTVNPEGRPLSARVEALARRFEAQAIGHRKRAQASAQDADNAQRDAQTLFDAAVALRKVAP